jgi:hypothetical protein
MAEIRKIHIAARQIEEFPLLESHYEMRERPALCKVIRTALAPDMTSRTYNDAFELKAAWDKAKQTDISLSEIKTTENPWHLVRSLTSQAEQCFAAGDHGGAEKLLEQAIRLNQDKHQVPDDMVNGKTYYLMVQALIRKNNSQEAGSLASEGYSRKKNRYTCMAMASYYQSLNPQIAKRFSQEAEKFPQE